MLSFHNLFADFSKNFNNNFFDLKNKTLLGQSRKKTYELMEYDRRLLMETSYVYRYIACQL